jgi:hypothetical protein
MFLVQCDGVQRFVEHQTSWVMLRGVFVRPVSTPAGTEYAGIEDADFPYSELPKGPLELMRYPDAGNQLLTIRRYRVGSSLGGPVFICFFLPDRGFDDSSFLGKVYALREISGEGGIEPLFTEK